MANNQVGKGPLSKKPVTPPPAIAIDLDLRVSGATF